MVIRPGMAPEFEDAAMICPQIGFQKSGRLNYTYKFHVFLQLKLISRMCQKIGSLSEKKCKMTEDVKFTIIS